MWLPSSFCHQLDHWVRLEAALHLIALQITGAASYVVVIVVCCFVVVEVNGWAFEWRQAGVWRTFWRATTAGLELGRDR